MKDYLHTALLYLSVSLVSYPFMSKDIHRPGRSKSQYEFVFFNSTLTNRSDGRRSNSLCTECSTGSKHMQYLRSILRSNLFFLSTAASTSVQTIHSESTSASGITQTNSAETASSGQQDQDAPGPSQGKQLLITQTVQNFPISLHSIVAYN